MASAIEGSTATVVLSGLPGDRAYLLRSSDTTNMFVPAKSGTQLYATPISLRTMLGTLTSTGLVVQVPFEDVMPPGSARVEYWQLQVTPAGMPLDHRV